MDLRCGDAIEVFYQMPFAEDQGEERQEVGDRWILSLTATLGCNRPRMGWSQRWLPARVLEVLEGSVRFIWEQRHWYDWATGEAIQVTRDPEALVNEVATSEVRRRTPGAWRLTGEAWTQNQLYPRSSEVTQGGCEVAVSFVVLLWGQAAVHINYDTHSWGEEGSTVSQRFIRRFFRDAVAPELPKDYEVLSVFIQQAEDLSRLSPELLRSQLCGQRLAVLYFLWPIQAKVSHGEPKAMEACYVEADRLFQLVSRMEQAQLPTRWPHPLQLWRLLASKEWMSRMCLCPELQIPLTTCVSKATVLCDPRRAAQMALDALAHLGLDVPHVVCKLGYSYEALDVKFAGPEELPEALYFLLSQANYLSDCVYVQQRVAVSCEARCFLLRGEIRSVLYTRFRSLRGGFVRDYEKLPAAEALGACFGGDAAAWGQAQEQMRRLSRRWHRWLLAQCAEPTVSVRIDYLLEHVAPGHARVWTGEVGELGYSTCGMDCLLLFQEVLKSLW